MTGSKCTNLSSEPTVLGGEGDIEGGLAEEAQRKKAGKRDQNAERKTSSQVI
jgi:hypothetical protein